ncbi:hypothetical protein GE09DRAFT_1224492 [Coniochaeta sp. 2T2.1]|nr:hypothetical protein GE09DRAFT_1224492 [Coniochaeta sp. 2T2.1]
MLNVLIKLGSQLHTLELYLHSLVDDENEIDDRVDIWTPFLRSIAQHCSLKEFEIRTPHTTYPNSGWRQRSDREFAFPLIYFRSQQNRDSGAEACNFKHFSGLDVSADIEALADILYTPWPEEDDWLRDDQDSWGDPLSDGGDGEDDGEDDSEDDNEDDSEDGDEDGNGDGDADVDGDGDESSDDSD